MKLNNLMSLDNAIFAQMKRVHAEQYEELFEDMEPSLLDLDFFTLHGEKAVAPLVLMFVKDGVMIADGMERIAQVALNKYFDKWRRIHNTLTEEYDAFHPYHITDSTEISEETHGMNESETVTDYDVAAAFNSTAMVDDKDTRVKDAGNSDSTRTQTKMYQRSGNIGNTSFSDYIQKELNARQVNYLDLIYKDLAELLTLQIYE